MRTSWVVLLIILIATAVYAPSFSNAFIGDDGPLIVQNPLIRGFSHIKEIFTSSYIGENVYYGPLAIFSHTIEFPFFGLNLLVVETLGPMS